MLQTEYSPWRSLVAWLDYANLTMLPCQACRGKQNAESCETDDPKAVEALTHASERILPLAMSGGMVSYTQFNLPTNTGM